MHGLISYNLMRLLQDENILFYRIPWAFIFLQREVLLIPSNREASSLRPFVFFSTFSMAVFSSSHRYFVECFGLSAITPLSISGKCDVVINGPFTNTNAYSIIRSSSLMLPGHENWLNIFFALGSIPLTFFPNFLLNLVI